MFTAKVNVRLAIQVPSYSEDNQLTTPRSSEHDWRLKPVYSYIVGPTQNNSPVSKDRLPDSLALPRKLLVPDPEPGTKTPSACSVC